MLDLLAGGFLDGISPLPLRCEDNIDYCRTEMLIPYFSKDLLIALVNRLDALKYDTRPHILTASHAVFSYGGDLELFLDSSKNRLLAYGELCGKLVLTSFNLKQLTVSWLNGDALGGGLEAALTTDIRILHKNARIGFPEARFKTFPGMGAVQLMDRLQLPKTLLFTAVTWGSEKALQEGIVASVETKEPDWPKALDEMHPGIVSMLKLQKEINPLDEDILWTSVEMWAESIVNMTDQSKALIERILSRRGHLIKEDMLK